MFNGILRILDYKYYSFIEINILVKIIIVIVVLIIIIIF